MSVDWNLNEPANKEDIVVNNTLIRRQSNAGLKFVCSNKRAPRGLNSEAIQNIAMFDAAYFTMNDQVLLPEKISAALGRITALEFIVVKQSQNANVCDQPNHLDGLQAPLRLP